jgi:hypothetical protein
LSSAENDKNHDGEIDSTAIGARLKNYRQTLLAKDRLALADALSSEINKIKFSQTDALFVGLRERVPAHWTELVSSIILTGWNSSQRAQLDQNSTSEDFWASLLDGFAHPLLNGRVDSWKASMDEGDRHDRNDSKLAKLESTLRLVWDVTSSQTRPVASMLAQRQVVTAALQLVRELVGGGLVKASLQALPVSGVVNGPEMRVCLFLANNDALLNLNDASWQKIESLSEDEFLKLLWYLVLLEKSAAQATRLPAAPSPSEADLKKQVADVKACLGALNIPIAVEPAVAALPGLIESFARSYFDPYKNVDRFRDHLYECMNRHYEHKNIRKPIYKSPYTAIIQASGVGKSKLIVELGNTVPVIYVSFSQATGTGFPRRTVGLVNHFEFGFAGAPFHPDLPALRLCGIFIAGFRCLMANNCSPSAFIAAQDIASSYGSKGVWYSNHEVDKIDGMTLSDACSLLVEEANKLAHQWQRDVGDGQPPCMILAVDEARELLNVITDKSSDAKGRSGSEQTTNRFRLVRNALQVLAVAVSKTKLRIFSVFTDTSSRISNFIPTSQADPSRRAADPYLPLKLHKPFWLVLNSDIFYESNFEKAHAKSSVAAIARTALSAADLLVVHFSKFCMYRIGRPLWTSLVYKSYNDDVEFAAIKLLGGKSFIDRAAYKPSVPEALAVLSARVPISLQAYGHLSADLPAQHMRLITGVSEDRELVFSEYGPEPVLAAASEDFMTNYDNFKPSDLLQVLRYQLSWGMVDTGGIGERMVALQYILARDRALASSISVDESFPLISVKDLLLHLHSDSVSSLARASKMKSQSVESDMEAFLSGKTSFSQFIDVKYTPCVEDLLDAFLLGAAIICRPGQAGVDLVIPVMLPPSGSESAVEQSFSSQAKLSTDRSFKKIPGVFQDSSAIVFDGLDKSAMQKKDPYFGSIADMRKNWRAKTSMTSKLLSETADANVYQSLLERMSCICINSKNSDENSASESDKISPDFAHFCDVAGTWGNASWSKPFVSIKHVLHSAKASLRPMPHNASTPLRHGLILKGFDEDKQPCLQSGLAAAMLQVVDTVANPCLTAEDNIGSRLASAIILTAVHKLDDHCDVIGGMSSIVLKAQESPGEPRNAKTKSQSLGSNSKPRKTTTRKIKKS